jgi:E3 ubiquitin-protein ligase BRE1
VRSQKAEKERDDLLETNVRLLKQNMEKDDMNAKSLSTILHLKSLTEQAEKDKQAQEQEAKSAEQVALAARLAENAKDRVAEEALKEKKVSEETVVRASIISIFFGKLTPTFMFNNTNSFWKTRLQSWKKSVIV